MKLVWCGALAFAACALVVVFTVLPQRPGAKGDKEGKDGQKGGPPRDELWQVFPPPLLDELELTPEQEKQLEAIEKDLNAKLNKFLTDEQKKKIANFRSRGPGGKGPKGEKGDKGEKSDKGERPDRPSFEKAPPPSEEGGKERP